MQEPHMPHGTSTTSLHVTVYPRRQLGHPSAPPSSGFRAGGANLAGQDSRSGPWGSTPPLVRSEVNCQRSPGTWGSPEKPAAVLLAELQHPLPSVGCPFWSLTGVPCQPTQIQHCWGCCLHPSMSDPHMPRQPDPLGQD